MQMLKVSAQMTIKIDTIAASSIAVTPLSRALYLCFRMVLNVVLRGNSEYNAMLAA